LWNGSAWERGVNSSAFEQVPHRRFNPLTREWVLVSPQRTQRPWLGRVEAVQRPTEVEYDPQCYLCPGNERAGGVRNPRYIGTFAFDNDYAAMVPDTSPMEEDEQGLLVARSERGICRVLCFSPRHDLTIPRMSQRDVRAVVDLWAEQMESFAAIPWVRHVQIFENRGVLMGASNPHPHCQVWANASIPNLPEREMASSWDYWQSRKSCLLCDYLQLEISRRERVVCENEAFACVVPYWAVWPFETLLLSRRHLSSLLDLTPTEKDLLADILRRITTRYDNVFETSFPYSMGFHQRPLDGQPHSELHFHAHYFPPLLRSATVQKFMVGYEMLAAPQRDVTPESAAAKLIEAGEIHYLDRRS